MLARKDRPKKTLQARGTRKAKTGKVFWQGTDRPEQKRFLVRE